MILQTLPQICLCVKQYFACIPQHESDTHLCLKKKSKFMLKFKPQSKTKQVIILLSTEEVGLVFQSGIFQIFHHGTTSRSVTS